EYFHTEIGADGAAERDALDGRHVNGAQIGATECAARAVAERPLRLEEERGWTDPLIRTAEDGARRRAARGKIGTIEPGVGRNRRRPLRARPVVLHEHRQRLPAPHRADAADLPHVYERACPASRRAARGPSP